jgi:hypothetical protein
MSVVQEKAVTALSAEEVRTIGVEAYVYLYPLVTMEITRRQVTNAPAGQRRLFGPMGEFAHAREFPAAEFRAVVRPNFDTLYSAAWLDLTREPMIVSVPDTAGRYYLMPILDMWTDVFAVPGKRITGTTAGIFAVVPPGWRGRVPDGALVIEAPTPYVWVLDRVQCNGPDDYSAIHALQGALTVCPLSQWGKPPRPVEAPIDLNVDMTTPPLDQVNALPVRDYFRLGAELMKLHSPHLTDWSILARLRKIGVLPGGSFDYDGLDETVRSGLEGVPGEALAQMRAAIPRMGTIVDGWLMNTTAMGVYGNMYLQRAVVTMLGLGANPPEDAIYPLSMGDADGQPLDGSHDYVLHFAADEIPPVRAFWSVTMYDAEGFQAANPLNRFAIGDRDRLMFNEDGSLDLFLQHENPGPDKEANWLPAPRGPLGVTMRLYWPDPQALDGRWNPPPIRRVS